MKVVTALMRDPNRIHFDVDAVQAAGMGDRLINQGPISAAFILDDLINLLGTPKSWVAMISYRSNTFEGDQLTTSAVVTSQVTDSDGCERYDVEVSLINHDGTVVLQGQVQWITAASAPSS